MAQIWGQVESWGQGAPAPLLKPLVGRGGPRARAGLTPSCGHSRPCLQLWAGGCPPRQAPPWALLSSVSRLVPVLPPQTRGSLGLGLGAPGQAVCCLAAVSTTLPPSRVGPGRRPRFPGEPQERGRWTWRARPLGCEFSFLAEGLGRARTPWGDEGPRGLSCGAGISRATQRVTALATVQPPPPGMRRAAAQRWGDHTPAPPAVGQLPGQLPAPEPRQAALSLCTWVVPFQDPRPVGGPGQPLSLQACPKPWRFRWGWVPCGQRKDRPTTPPPGRSLQERAARKKLSLTAQPHGGGHSGPEARPGVDGRAGSVGVCSMGPGGGERVPWWGSPSHVLPYPPLTDSGAGRVGGARDGESVSRGGGPHPTCCLAPCWQTPVLAHLFGPRGELAPAARVRLAHPLCPCLP